MERCFLAALLHDIGEIFALHALSDLLREGRSEEPIAPALLAAVLEGVHVELGAELAAHWRLPASIAAACGAHHDDPPPAGDVEVHAVRVVSGLDEIRRNPFHRQGLVGQVLDSAVALELDAVRLRALLAELKEVAARGGACVRGRPRT